MKVYKLYLAKPLLILYLCIFAAWVLGAISGIIITATGAFGSDAPPPWLFAIALAFGLFTAYMWLRFPYEIRVEGNTAEFRSIFRKTAVPLTEIKSVRAKLFALGFVDIAHERGTVHLLSQMDGFHDLILTIKLLNPTIKIKGC